MKSTLLVALIAITAGLAGCTDSGDETPMLTEEDCAALGLVLGHKEVMEEESMGESMEPETDGEDESMMDDNATAEEETPLRFPAMRQANETGNETAMEEETADDSMPEGAMEDEHAHGDHGEELACVPAGPPATVSMDGLPASSTVYSPLSFTWTLNTETDEEMHTMDTQVRWSTESVADDALGMPGTFGDEVAKKEHQNFFDGQTYNGTITPEMEGTYYFRAFALVNGENLWSPEYIVAVGPVEPTGVTHTITCNSGGAPSFGSCSPDPLDIMIGDAVAWANGNPASLGGWDITISGPEDASTTAGGDAVVILTPGSYTYDAEGDLGTVSGAINAKVPTE